MNRKTISLSLVGTTPNTQISILPVATNPASEVSSIRIGRIRVRTGRLGSFEGLTTVGLDGPMSPLFGTVSSLQFDTIGSSAQISVNGDLGQMSVNQGVELGPSGHINIQGNLSSLSVGGSVQFGNPAGGELRVGGNLGTLSVGGDVQGIGRGDIFVGDDLNQLTVLGGAVGGGLRNTGIDVSKSIQGLDIRNGVFQSVIMAGILINGGTPGSGSNGWNIGPDGKVAVLDSQILAGSAIQNIIIGGDVVSDLPENPAGSPTRIVAGEYPEGTYSSAGTIDSFQITGQLVDSVLAASVEPYNGFYPQPAGTIQVGFVPEPPSPPTIVDNFTAPPFANSDVPADQIVLPGGSINRSFISPSAPLPPSPTPGTPVPIPSKSTVLGGVVTNKHGTDADYAGIFAADTRGVIVGPLPPDG